MQMNDFEILQHIHDELKKAKHPPYNPSVIEFYGRLLDRVPEEGFELTLLDKDLSEKEEQAFRELWHYEYFGVSQRHQLTEGIIYNIDLRVGRFLEIANSQTHSVVVGMKDTGRRETFSTGAVRDSAEEKPRPELISPFAMERLAEWLRKGAEKYTPRNWERGIPISRSTASLCRHLLKFQMGSTDEDHVAAILCNAMFIAHTQEMIKRGILPESLDDLPKYEIPSACNDKVCNPE